MAQKKQEELKRFMAKELAVGDKVIAKKGLFDQYARNPEGDENCIITGVLGDNKYEITVNTTESWRQKAVIVSESEIKRNTFDVGANPFPEKSWNRAITFTNFDVGGIMSIIGQSALVWGKDVHKSVKDEYTVNGITALECNFNPYVVKDGKKLYYQRDYCWSLEDKQLLIESIYQSMNCGTILLRKRSFRYVDNELKKGNKEVGFFDVVDGKQRIACIIEFMSDGFKDMHGNYFSDLSDRARWYFRDCRSFTYGEMGEGATDEEVIEAFLHVNFTGVPMSKEHIEYVKEIHNKIKV